MLESYTAPIADTLDREAVVTVPPADAAPASKPASEIDRWVGQVLEGRYRIDGRLAEGGFGVVYRGTQIAFDRPVAVKLLHAAEAGSAAQAARFRQEARAIAQIRHHGVVQVIDFGELAPEGSFYLVMELLEGPTLAAHLTAHAPLPPDRVIDLGLEVLDALAEAHARGVIHRDLKPENLILSRQGDRDVLKLVDFGIAKVVGRPDADAALTQVGMLLGSPRYLSPEQAGDLPVSDRTDIYSLGAVLYEALLGRPAFTRQGVREYLAAHLGEPPDPPLRAGVPVRGRLVQTLLRFMAKDPGERPSARQAAALLESCRGEALGEATLDRRAPKTSAPAADRRPSVVGRERELDRFASFLDDDTRVLSFVGPGGMGKTTLLAACCEHARARGLTLEWLDGAELANLSQLLAVTFAPILREPPDLLVIDRLEHAWGIVDGLRDGILPRLPKGTKVLLAGRRELGWGVHPSLSGAVTELALGPLPVAAACALLAARGVPERLRVAVCDEAGGHPLTLALLADLLRDSGQSLATLVRLHEAPSLLHRLAKELVEQVPSDAHRRGLLAASLVRRLTEDDLRTVMSPDDVAAVHRWLSELAGARRGQNGLELHELTRRVIVLETRLHHPERVRELIELLGARALARMRAAPPASFRDRLFDTGFLMGQLLDTPYEPVDFGEVRPPLPAEPHHFAQIEELARRFEGPRAVETLRAWRGPHSHTIVFCEGDAVLGYATGFRLDSAPPELVALDPGTAALSRLLFDERRLSRERVSLYFRFWAGPNHHLACRVQTQINLYFLLLATTMKNLGALITAHHPPAFWRPLHVFSAHEMFEAAAFAVDGREFLPFGRDFSAVSRRDWLIEHFERIFEVRHGIPGAAPSLGTPDGALEAIAGAFEGDIIALGHAHPDHVSPPEPAPCPT